MAVFLMDTQGLFDNITSKKNETILGMLSFLLSSMQIFNVKHNIESIHKDHIYVSFMKFLNNSFSEYLLSRNLD